MGTLDQFFDKIDEISSMDPVLMKRDKEIAIIVAYQRKMRQEYEAGVKPKKEKVVGKPTKSLAEIMGAKKGTAVPAAPMVRRV